MSFVAKTFNFVYFEIENNIVTTFWGPAQEFEKGSKFTKNLFFWNVDEVNVTFRTQASFFAMIVLVR